MKSQALHSATAAFFSLYWNQNLSTPPEWSEPWDFNSELPNNGKKGCYALIDENDEVIYIGVAISKPFAEYKTKGAYQPGGLGARLKAYWMVDKSLEPKTKYTTTANWDMVKSIQTIGFDDEHYWLAAALEIYLIEKLQPIRNSKHKA